MVKGNFIKVRVDDLQNEFADYYKDYNNVCLYPSLHNTLMLDYELEPGETYNIELTPHAAELKEVVSNSYGFDYNNYIIIDDWAYFFEENIEIKRRK